MLELDQLAYRSRAVGISPLLKCITYVFLLSIALASGIYLQLSLSFVMAILSCYVVDISIRRYLKWLLLPLSFLAMSMLGLLISVSPDGQYMSFKQQIGYFYVGIYPTSFMLAFAAFLRSLCALSVTYLFVLTTPFNQLMSVFKRIHMPNILIEIIFLSYRFIFILIEEMSLIYKAQHLRFGYSTVKNSYRSLGLLASMLLIRVMARYDAMTISLDLKLYQGHFPSH